MPETLEHPVLLKLDTQGAEIEVLKGLGSRISEIDVLIVEAAMMEARHGIPQFADIVRFCDEAGFVVYDLLEGHMRAIDGALAQIDLAFVRKDSVLRQQTVSFDAAQLAAYLNRPSRLRAARRFLIAVRESELRSRPAG